MGSQPLLALAYPFSRAAEQLLRPPWRAPILLAPKLRQTALSFEAFLNQVRQPTNQMPRQTTDMLSDKEASEIYAWLHGPAAVAAPTKDDFH